MQHNITGAWTIEIAIFFFNNFESQRCRLVVWLNTCHYRHSKSPSVIKYQRARLRTSDYKHFHCDCVGIFRSDQLSLAREFDVFKIWIKVRKKVPTKMVRFCVYFLIWINFPIFFSPICQFDFSSVWCRVMRRHFFWYYLPARFIVDMLIHYFLPFSEFSYFCFEKIDEIKHWFKYRKLPFDKPFKLIYLDDDGGLYLFRFTMTKPRRNKKKLWWSF